MNEINNVLTAVKNMDIATIIPLIASGGITVWLISQLSKIFNCIKKIILQIISFKIYNIHSDDRGSECGRLFTNSQVAFDNIITKCKTIWERTCNLDLERNIMGNYKKLQNFNKNLTYGTSIKILYGKLCICSRHIRTETQKIVIDTELTIFFARKNKFIKKLNDEIKKQTDFIENVMTEEESVFVDINNSWVEKERRKLSSIFTENDIHLKLYNDIKDFIDNKQIYIDVNYPYKYTALLYGVPGAGKSSTILALASELKMNIRYINVSNTDIDQYIDYCRNMRIRQQIIVFEDIDAAFVDVTSNRIDTNNNTTNKSTKKSNNMSLSDLLNITDGLLSGDGVICIFTTNHIEKLDSALIRAGRMNSIIEFKYFNSETANKMIKHHLGVTIDNLKDDIKPAELQDSILNIMLNKATIDDLKEKFCK